MKRYMKWGEGGREWPAQDRSKRRVPASEVRVPMQQPHALPLLPLHP